jgi:hypothetical protein
VDDPQPIAGPIGKAVLGVTLHLFTRRRLITDLGRPKRVAPPGNQLVLLTVVADTVTDLIHPALRPFDSDHLGVLEPVDDILALSKSLNRQCVAGQSLRLVEAPIDDGLRGSEDRGNPEIEGLADPFGEVSDGGSRQQCRRA